MPIGADTAASQRFTNRLDVDLGSLLRCPECHGVALARDDDESVLRCDGCDTTFPMDPQAGVCSLLPAAAQSAIKNDIRSWWGDLYRQLYAEHEKTLDAASIDEALAHLEDLFRRRRHLAVVEIPLGTLAGKTVLEIGSGSGAHSALFQRAGASVIAVDITPERVIGSAHKLALVTKDSSPAQGRAYQADAENLPFRDDSFDIVYSNGVLHHSEDTARCIDEVYRVLKPGGKAVLMLYARHSSIFWLNIVPRAILSGEILRWPEAQWIGRLTEGKPTFGTTKNPITRVYSRRQLRTLLRRFTITSLRKSSFQLDNFCVPRLTQIRKAILRALGYKAHPGGILVYGTPYMAETAFELALGPYLGWCWNIFAEKPR